MIINVKNMIDQDLKSNFPYWNSLITLGYMFFIVSIREEFFFVLLKMYYAVYSTGI